ncbi:hypothetical protein ZWY2020_007117 [Hordeum vulgare]|nr:hypothetical protein ZWY2020_007117 [Hordeum vulgare]
MMLAYMDLVAAATERDALEPTVVAAGAAECAVVRDFGGLKRFAHVAVVRAKRHDVTSTKGCTRHDTLPAHGNGHSVVGRAMSNGGLVLDMRAGATSRRQQMKLVSSCGGAAFADVPGGALWEEFRHWAVSRTMASPPPPERTTSGSPSATLSTTTT